jgi:hypothetical protein
MRMLVVFAAFVLVCSGAQAAEKYNFDVGGRTIHIDPDRGIVSIPGVYESGPKRAKRSRDDSNDDAPAKSTPSQSRVDPLPGPAPQATPGASTLAPSASAPPPSANLKPTDPSAPERLFGPRAQPDTTPSARLAAPSPAPDPATAASPVREASANDTTPLGVWLTEEKEGRVRIEQCGGNLCGYALSKTDQNGEKVLIDMKPVSGIKWSGKIHDPKSGSTYDSSIAMKGSDSLRVQGCAFGGMFCGGQTWTRVN